MEKNFDLAFQIINEFFLTGMKCCSAILTKFARNWHHLLSVRPQSSLYRILPGVYQFREYDNDEFLTSLSMIELIIL